MSSQVPPDLKYTASHEWIRKNEDGSVTVGITDHAQHALGDIVFIETPEAGREISSGEACSVVESVKAASDVYSPIAGQVLEGNGLLSGAPELVNTDPYGSGWLFRIEPVADGAATAILDAQEYQAVLVAAGD
jgi:glycine cleavage system H protein